MKRFFFVALVVLLFAERASAETFTDGTAFTIDVDTTGACIVVPAERRVQAACEGVESIPTQLPAIGGRETHYVFLASLPLPSSGRYWFGVIRVVPIDGVDRDGLTPDRFTEMKVALKNVASRLDAFEVSEPNPSEIGSSDGIDRVAIHYNAWKRGGDRRRYYSASFSLYFGSQDYIVQTFVEGADEAIAERRSHTLEKMRVPNRDMWTSFDPAKVVAWIRALMLAAAMLVVTILVVRDALAWRGVEPQRDPATADLRSYTRPRGVGIGTAILLLVSAAISSTSYAFTSALVVAIVRLFAAVAALAAVVLLLVWIHRTVTNARALGCTGVMTPSMAVVWFFIPVASAYVPYRAVAEVAASARVRRRAMRMNRLVVLWWLAWIASIAARLMEQRVASLILTILTAIFFWRLATALDHAHERLRKELVKT